MGVSMSVLSFLGATVIEYSTSVGWNEQQTTITIKIVEDPAVEDDFLLKESSHTNNVGQMIGTPVSFIHGQVRFDGLILGFKELNSIQGKPTYEVTLTSPLEVLRGVKVILSNYIGPVNDSLFNATPLQQTPTFQVTNLLNVFGYLEAGGSNFGNSLINDTGLFWTGSHGVKAAIEHLTGINPNTTTNYATNFGSYIIYRGNYYTIDFSGLPVPPDFYRIGGNVFMSLMDIVSQIAQDGGVDYLSRITMGTGNGPHRIWFKTVDRVQQLSLGKLSQLIAGKTDVESDAIGMELRNDITEAFIVGGDINFLTPLENWTSDNPSVVPFWGFDVDGNPITGVKSDGTFFADDDHAMLLNSSSIADVTGALGLGVSYPCTILELRCALMNYDSWAAFLLTYKTLFAKLLGIVSRVQVYYEMNIGGIPVPVFDTASPQFAHDLVADNINAATSYSNMNLNNQWTSISQRVYDFVRTQAETYYGKKFLVKIPFQLQLKIIPNTTEVIYSDEPADAGYIVEGSLPLGLNFVNENFFMDQTGRFYPFLRFPTRASFGSVTTIANRDRGLFNPSNPLPGLNNPLANQSSPNSFVVANYSLLDSNYIVQPNNPVGIADPQQIINDSNQYTNFLAQNPNEPGAASQVNTDLLAQALNVNVNNGNIYTRCDQGEPGPVLQNGLLGGGGLIVFARTNLGVPYAAMVCSIPSPIFAQAFDPLGGVQDIATILGVSPQMVARGAQFRLESFPMRLHPPAIYPNGVAIALKSNQYTYGPWGKYTTDGQVEFEYDPSLTPWEYGSYSIMNQAASARLLNIATGNQVLERGEFTEPGAPLYDLADFLVADGPIVTSIDASVSSGGIKTNYTMETFVPRLGVFSKQNADRLKQYGKNIQQMRRAIRQTLLAQRDTRIINANASQGFMYGTSYVVAQSTPHAVLMGHVVADSGNEELSVPLLYSNTFSESVGNVQSNSGDLFQATSCASWETLFRPVSMNWNPPQLISHFTSGDSRVINETNAIVSSDLQAAKSGSDFIWYASGNEYGGLNQSKTPGLYNDARIFGLRGPAILSGWGYDLASFPVPNAATGVKYQDFTNQFEDQYLKKSHDWPAGPIDLRWDKFRGIWCAPTIFTGKMAGDLPAGPNASGMMTITCQSGQISLDDQIVVYNYFRSSVSKGTRVVASYYPLDDAYYVTSADCVSS